MAKQPNILMIVSDEERRNGWLDGKADMPAHDRLAAALRRAGIHGDVFADNITFTNF